MWGLEPSLPIAWALGGQASIMSKVAHFSRVVGGHQMMFLGAFGGQTLLHFLLWVFNPRLRSNAYFTLTTACAAALVGLHFERVLSDDPQFVWLCYRIWNVLLILTMMTLVRFAYEVFDRKPRWVFFGLSGSAALTLIGLEIDIEHPRLPDVWIDRRLAEEPFVLLVTDCHLRATEARVARRVARKRRHRSHRRGLLRRPE